MPSVIGELNALERKLQLSTMPAFARAKMGTIM